MRRASGEVTTSMRAVYLFLWHLAICLQAQARSPLPPPPAWDEARDRGDYGLYPTRSYRTVKDIQSPDTNFVQWSPECDDGMLTFLTPRGHSLPRPGPTILDARGELIWHHYFENSFGGQAYNFLVQKYQGEDHLTFWLGDDRVRGHGAGFYYLLNSSYDVVQKIGAANGLSADLHEFLLTDEDTALMSLYEIIPGDVSMFRQFDPVHNPQDREPNFVWDGIFQEIDVETGELLFEWRASEHVPVTDTYRPIYGMGNKNDPFDWYHINSVQKDELGNYLVSARYPHSVMYIDGKTKDTIWQLGGKANHFMDLSNGDALNFAWQHDARFYPLDTFPESYTPPPERAGFTTKLLALFDNAAEDQHYDYGLPFSRGLILEVTYPTPGTRRAPARPGEISRSESELTVRDEERRDFNVEKILAINRSDPDYTARVIKSYINPKLTRSSSQGNIQLIPQGAGEDPKVFVGYGLDAVWTEFDGNGTVLCDVHYGPQRSWDTGHIQSYRVYKFSWTGRPRWAPSVEISEEHNLLYVSWLGATEVDEWVLQYSRIHSEDDKDWASALRAPKISFETTMVIPDEIGDARYLRIVALGEGGTPLEHGISEVFDRGIMASYFPGISEKLPERVTHLSPLKVLLIAVSNVSILFMLYELYRRYLSWRLGRPGAGPLRWRKGPAYRLLAEA